MPDVSIPQTVSISHQPVELYKILKFEGLVGSGAQAKQAIDEGLVSVNDEVETRRRRKIVNGDVIRFDNLTLAIVLSAESSS